LVRARVRLGVMATALAVLVVACGGGSGSRGPSGSDDSLSGSIRVAAAGSEDEIAALRAVADAFTEGNPEATVDLDTAPDPGEVIAKLTTALVAGNAPDVFVLNHRRLGGFAARDAIDPVSGVDTSGLYPKTLTAFRFDGTLLCLPSNAASMVVYVNPSLFDRAGVELPAGAWTWDDMLAKARAIHAKGVSAIGFEPALVRLAPFAWSNGAEIVDDLDRPTVVDLSSTGAREAVRFLLDLQATGMSATDRAAQDPEEAFSAGKTAMYLDSRRVVPGFRKVDGLRFDVAPVPTKVSAVSVLHSDGYCVTKSSEHKALARAFAAFAVTGPGARILVGTGRTVPALRSLAESSAFLDESKAPRSSRVFLDQLEVVRALPHSPTWNEAEEAVEEVLTQLFADKLTLDEAIDEVTARTKRELAKA
jgi:multiple sugar transport system substrate-binding protein